MAQSEDGPSQCAQLPEQPWVVGALAASPSLAARAVLSPSCPQRCLRGCVCCPAFRGGEGMGGTAGGGCHFVDQANYSHVLWTAVQEHSPRLIMSVGDAGGLCAATAKRS